MASIIMIIVYVVAIFILYVVIRMAVRDGINSSIIGQVFEKKYEVGENKRSFLDRDLDNDK